MLKAVAIGDLRGDFWMIYKNKYKKIKREKNIKNVDFVFIYEVAKREIQGISLIGLELINRGYSVAYINTWHALHFSDTRYKAEVVILFGAYNTNVINFGLSFIESCKHVYNMQWEQILNKHCLKVGSEYILSGDAKRVYHTSWGIKNKKHLTEICKIDNDKVNVMGHVGHDFLRKEFDSFYKSKEKIAFEYGFNVNFKIVLFISSFAHSDFYDGEMDICNTRSRVKITDWLIRYALENQDAVVIYRKHPAEVVPEEIVKKLRQQKNIKIINDYSVQQWIKISDFILNWWSTAIGDISVAGKGCVIVRPYPIPEEDEYFYLKDAKKAETYEQMIVQMEENVFPIEIDKLKEYYFQNEQPAYMRVANKLIAIYDSTPSFPYASNKKKSWKEKKYILEMRELYGLLKSFLLKKPNEDILNSTEYHWEMIKENYVSEKKIIRLMNRIEKILLDNNLG